MKIVMIIGCIVIGLTTFAQTKLEKSIPAKAGQKLVMSFEDAELIKVQTWDKKEVFIKGTVSINNGDCDSAFVLEVRQQSDEIQVASRIKDKDNLPHIVTIRKEDMEYVFKVKDRNAPEVQKFLQEHGNIYNYISEGIKKEITLEVFIPTGMETQITSKFAMIEVRDFRAPIAITAQHGGVDASIAPQSIGELTARTQFGEILTNLDIRFDNNNTKDYDHWTVVSAKPGTGPRYTFESKFGKVYLRKQ